MDDDVNDVLAIAKFETFEQNKLTLFFHVKN